MTHQYESEILNKLMVRDGFNIPSSVPPYEAEIKVYLINQVEQAYPKLTDYEAEWLLYNYTKHLPADFPISSVSNVTEASFENVVPFAYQSAILKGNTGYRDIDTGEFLETFEKGRNLELVSVKMPVLTTTGKNLFEEEWVQGTIGLTHPNFITTKNIINVPSGKTLIFSNSLSLSIQDYHLYYNGELIQSFIDYRKKTIAIPSNANGIKITIYNSGGINPSSLTFAQLEEGTTPTTYEPHKTNILTVNGDVELRGIGDVQDTLDCLTGEVTQRIGEAVLDGSGRYNIGGGSNDNYLEFIYSVNPNSKRGSVLCDKVFTPSGGHQNNVEYIRTTESGIIGYILKTRLSTPDVDGLKAWLSSNNVTVQYQLATPVIKTVDLKCINQDNEETYFIPIEGTMHVSTSGQPIQPKLDMSVPVEATTQNLASFVDLEMEE